jgi:small nuclear ribonucleoprotein (snRNP)-like protein
MQLVELKNGETYNGHLVNCDGWMNINLRDVICTSRVCARFLQICLPKAPPYHSSLNDTAAL